MEGPQRDEAINNILKGLIPIWQGTKGANARKDDPLTQSMEDTMLPSKTDKILEVKGLHLMLPLDEGKTHDKNGAKRTRN